MPVALAEPVTVLSVVAAVRPETFANVPPIVIDASVVEMTPAAVMETLPSVLGLAALAASNDALSAAAAAAASAAPAAVTMPTPLMVRAPATMPVAKAVAVAAVSVCK